MKITDKMAAQAELIAQAHRDGREVLERDGSGEITEGSFEPLLGAPDYTYELAPKEPAVCWRNEMTKSGGGTRYSEPFDDKETAVAIGLQYVQYLRTVKFVEASE